MTNIIFEIKETYAIIRLNRPSVFNSFNRAMALEVQAALDECGENQAIRAVMLIGEGRAFCAGQDLGEIVAPDGPSLPTILQEHYNPIITRIRLLQKPVVAAVNGVAAGAGANIALACDVAVATASASFIQAFSKIGLIPDSGGTFFLPRLIGFQKASALMMLGDKISATDAEKMGMIYKVCPDESFLAEAENITKTLSLMPTRGLWLTKKALNESMTNTIEQQLVVEDKYQTEASLTSDYKEGVNAFLEKRKAEFKGF
jgi:2-(1,2-epoxy-1,2-dihydrophenyl)acetyl-CoA isomerase